MGFETGGSTTDLLTDAGYSSGDLFLVPAAHSSSTFSTASSSYTTVARPDINYQLAWDFMYPTGVTGALGLAARLDPNTDQIDCRFRNITDGETIVETTGITGPRQEVLVGTTAYTPTTRDTPIGLDIQIRNADGATTVTIDDFTFLWGVEL